MRPPVHRLSVVELARLESIKNQPAHEFKIVKRLAFAVGGLMLASSGVALGLSPTQPHDTAHVTVEAPPAPPKITAEPTTSSTTRPATTTTKPKPPATTAPKPTTTVTTAKPSIVHAASVPHPNINYGIDVSWPEGNCTAPASALNLANFVIVGINDGMYKFNDSVKFNDQSAPVNCFLTELSAARQAELYVNPGAPITAADLQRALNGPERCTDLSSTPIGCAYNYGFNGGVADTNFIRDYLPLLAQKQWNHRLWVDVENCDPACFTSNSAVNNAAIEGLVDGLRSGFKENGQLTIGFYSTEYVWNSITAKQNNHYPDPKNSRQIWIATGPGTVATAKSWPSRVFDNGIPVFAQYSAYAPNSAPVADNAGRPLDYDLPVNELG